jgi:hypothetical protein
MDRKVDIKRLLASTMLIVSMTGFGATFYYQQAVGKLKAQLAANAQPKPECLSMLQQSDDLVASYTSIELPDETGA